MESPTKGVSILLNLHHLLTIKSTFLISLVSLMVAPQQRQDYATMSVVTSLAVEITFVRTMSKFSRSSPTKIIINLCHIIWITQMLEAVTSKTSFILNTKKNISAVQIPNVTCNYNKPLKRKTLGKTASCTDSSFFFWLE